MVNKAKHIISINKFKAFGASSLSFQPVKATPQIKPAVRKSLKRRQNVHEQLNLHSGFK
jgi:hypothetical protein